jgi:allantoicase
VLYKVKAERFKGESLDGGAVNELLVGLREEDMTKGLETNRSKKTGCLSLVSFLYIIIQ